MGYVVRFPEWRSIRRRASTESPTRTSSTQEHMPWQSTTKMTTPGCTWDPLEAPSCSKLVAIVRDDGTELAIHAMRMRAKYRQLLPEG